MNVIRIMTMKLKLWQCALIHLVCYSEEFKDEFLLFVFNFFYLIIIFSLFSTLVLHHLSALKYLASKPRIDFRFMHSSLIDLNWELSWVIKMLGTVRLESLDYEIMATGITLNTSVVKDQNLLMSILLQLSFEHLNPFH